MAPQDHSLGDPPVPSTAVPVTVTIEPYKSPRPLARALFTMLIITLLLHLVGAFAAFSAAGMANRKTLRGRGAALVFENRFDAMLIAVLIQISVFVVSSIVFIVWFRRAYRNLPALGARNLRYKPGWAVGAWFVPILGYFRPVQIASDIWKASDPAMEERVNTPWVVRSGSALVGWWWALWLIANFAAEIPFLGVEEEGLPSLADLRSLARGIGITEVFWLASTSLTLLLVWRVTARQEQRAEKLRQSGEAIPGLTD